MKTKRIELSENVKKYFKDTSLGVLGMTVTPEIIAVSNISCLMNAIRTTVFDGDGNLTPTGERMFKIVNEKRDREFIRECLKGTGKYKIRVRVKDKEEDL